MVTTDEAGGRVGRLLVLTADLVAEYEVEILDGSDRRLPVGQAGPQTLRVFSRRKGDVGRGSPDAVRCAPPLSAWFIGPPSERIRPDGIVESSRDVAVGLPATGDAGVHESEIELGWDGGLMVKQVIAWQATPKIRAIPAGIVLHSAEPRVTRTVVVDGVDHPFRIVPVSGPALVGYSPAPAGPSRSHRLRLELDARRIAGAADLTIETDHPDQKAVTLSLLVSPGTKGRGE